jgi:serine/threonine-protein kinase
MAPEQLAGRSVSIASDVYSLGLVLFELFTGKSAWSTDAIADLTRLQEEGPSRPSSLAADIDPAVERVILRCLSFHPAERPATALAVAAALPGGDPLAEALAAGETPSPGMVAAAGALGALRPAVAWGALAAVAAGAAVLVAFAGQTELIGHVPLPKEPAVLVAEAKAILRAAGQGDAPADEAWGFRSNERYLEYLGKDPDPKRLERIGDGPRSGLLFWYRRSPWPLSPVEPGGHRMSPDDPPNSRPGMSIVWLDTAGRLLKLETVPPEQAPEAPSPAAPDPVWDDLLAAAGLTKSGLLEVPSRWNPPFHSDRRVAWEAPAPGEPPLTVRVEGASYLGRPVSFRVIGPWEKAEVVDGERASLADKLQFAFGAVLMLGTMLGGLILALRNLRLGRGDLRGAQRVAAVYTMLHMAGWLLWGKHVWDGAALLSSFFANLSWTLWEGLSLFTLYLALEPFVRRRWPDSLISWSRLLAGRVRDPLVGRDLLWGCVLGIATALLDLGDRLASGWFGRPPSPPESGGLITLLGVRFVAGETIDLLLHTLMIPMLVLVLFLLLTALLRRPWAAVLAIIAIGILPEAFSPDRLWFTLVVGAVWISILLFAVVRLGLVAGVATVATSQLFLASPITAHLGAWYAGATIATLVVLAAMAGYGFVTSLGGRSPFGEGLLRE